MIALQVLWERAQGDTSSLAPWIAAMPAPGDLDLPLFWNEEDLALADASSTRVSKNAKRTSVYRLFLGVIASYDSQLYVSS